MLTFKPSTQTHPHSGVVRKMVWYGMGDVCGGLLAAEASRSSERGQRGGKGRKAGVKSNDDGASNAI